MGKQFLETSIDRSHAADFLKFAVAAGALRFGEFTLKSGRVSPYFFNIGALHTGRALWQLGMYYAHLIADSKIRFDILFGPAYKGIPLASVTAAYLAQKFDMEVKVAFNRKEKKTHGEGGETVGAPLTGKVLIIDDVITAGTAVREALALIKNADAEAVGVVISFDRKEHGRSQHSTIREFRDQYNIPVLAIADFDDLLNGVMHDPEYDRHSAALQAYADKYVCRDS